MRLFSCFLPVTLQQLQFLITCRSSRAAVFWSVTESAQRSSRDLSGSAHLPAAATTGAMMAGPFALQAVFIAGLNRPAVLNRDQAPLAKQPSTTPIHVCTTVLQTSVICSINRLIVIGQFAERGVQNNIHASVYIRWWPLVPVYDISTSVSIQNPPSAKYFIFLVVLQKANTRRNVALYCNSMAYLVWHTAHRKAINRAQRSLSVIFV